MSMKEFYHKDVVPALQKHFNYGNILRVPRLEKIVINMGLGRPCRTSRSSTPPWRR